MSGCISCTMRAGSTSARVSAPPWSCPSSTRSSMPGWGDIAGLYAAFASFSALVFADFQGRDPAQGRGLRGAGGARIGPHPARQRERRAARGAGDRHLRGHLHSSLRRVPRRLRHRRRHHLDARLRPRDPVHPGGRRRPTGARLAPRLRGGGARLAGGTAPAAPHHGGTARGPEPGARRPSTHAGGWRRAASPRRHPCPPGPRGAGAVVGPPPHPDCTPDRPVEPGRRSRPGHAHLPAPTGRLPCSRPGRHRGISPRSGPRPSSPPPRRWREGGTVDLAPVQRPWSSIGRRWSRC